MLESATEIAAALGSMQSAWMAGRPALEHCPAPWRPVAGGDEAALLALAGHAAAALLRPLPPAAIAPRPPLPHLALPVMPAALRPRLRRILSAFEKAGADVEREAITLIAARGFVAHPADWMPRPDADWAPEVYRPWRDWLRAGAAAAAGSALTAESYDALPWVERRAALEALRRTDPAAARAVIAAKAPGEPADRRIKLLDVLLTGLSEEDAAFLEGLLADRSERVRLAATGMLCRLGRADPGNELARELAELVEFEKAAPGGRPRLRLPYFREARKNQRRHELFGLVSLSALALALDAAPQDLVGRAPDGHGEALTPFVDMVVRTGTTALQCLMLQGLLKEGAGFRMLALAEQMNDAERRTMVPYLFANESNLYIACGVMGPLLGEVPFSAFRGSPAQDKLMRAAAGAAKESGSVTSNSYDYNHGLATVGCLLDAAGAETLLAELTGAGVAPTNPLLELLHLNAALAPERSS